MEWLGWRVIVERWVPGRFEVYLRRPSDLSFLLGAAISDRMVGVYRPIYFQGQCGTNKCHITHGAIVFRQNSRSSPSLPASSAAFHTPYACLQHRGNEEVSYRTLFRTKFWRLVFESDIGFGGALEMYGSANPLTLFHQKARREFLSSAGLLLLRLDLRVSSGRRASGVTFCSY